MKNGGTRAEVQTAILLAQGLANKYNIDINSIDETEPERQPITDINAAELTRLQFENKYSAMIINRFFNCKAFVLRGYKAKIIFVSTEPELEIAKYIYNFLVNHFRSEWRHHKGRLRNRQAFMAGLYHGLYEKLLRAEPRRQEAEGIVLSGHFHRLEEYAKDKWGIFGHESVKPDNMAKTALYRGYMAGLKTNIRTAVKSNYKQNLIGG